MLIKHNLKQVLPARADGKCCSEVVRYKKKKIKTILRRVYPVPCNAKVFTPRGPSHEIQVQVTYSRIKKSVTNKC